MLVAHAIWLDDRLAIWAEDFQRSPEPPRRPGRRPRRAPHPFAAGHDTLQEALDSLVAKAATGWRTLHLPAVGVAPVASPSWCTTHPGTGRSRYVSSTSPPSSTRPTRPPACCWTCPAGR